MWFSNGHIVDVTTGDVLRNRHIEVGPDGRIAQIQSDRPSTSEKVVDLNGQFILPGIISCHTHLSVVFPFSDTDERENPAITAYRAAQRAEAALNAGITTLRCVHEQNQVDLYLKAANKRGWFKSPRIFGAGRAISTPNGHGSGADCSYAEGFDGFYQAATDELKAGADHIKIFINGGLAHAGERPEDAEMTDEEIAGAVKAAHEHNTYVVAHSGASAAIMQALRQGVRSFEHIYQLDVATAEAMASAGAFVTPTLCVTRSESWMRANGFEEHSIQNALNASEQHLVSVKRAIAAKLPMINGTDYPPGDLVDGLSAALHELFLMHGAGLTPLQSLQSISSTAAKLLNRENELGQVAPKYFGDFIAVDENPLDNLDTLRKINLVVQGGSVVR
jgi:imidazolonepropionase-like amidohydrolase